MPIARRWILPFTVGEHARVEGNYRKEWQDAAFAAPYFLLLLLALGLTLSAAEWLTEEQTYPVNRWMVQTMLVIFMVIGCCSILAFWLRLHQYTRLGPGQVSLGNGSVRYFFMNHLTFIGLCIFFVLGIVLDAFPVYAEASCLASYIQCHLALEHFISILYHICRLVFKLFVVVFALYFEGREMEKRPIVRYCVLLIALPVLWNWFDFLVYDSVTSYDENRHHKNITYEHVEKLCRINTTVYPVYSTHFLGLCNCVNGTTDSYRTSSSVLKVLFPFDIEFSLLAAKIVIGIYLSIKLAPVYGSEGAGDPAESQTMGDQPHSLVMDGVHIVNPGDPETIRATAEPSPVGHHQDSAADGAGNSEGERIASVQMGNPLGDSGGEQDESRPLVGASPSNGSHGNRTIATGRHRRPSSYNTFENLGPGDVREADVQVRSMPPRFPVFMLAVVVFNVTLFVCGMMSRDTGYIAFTVCELVYWLPLLVASVLGIRAIGREFESDPTADCGLDRLVLVSMLGSFSQLYMMLYATIACLQGTRTGTEKCSDQYGTSILTAGLFSIVLNFVQMILQTTLMTHASRIRCTDTQSRNYSCLRACLLYMAIGNLVLWVVDSYVELNNPDIHPGQKFYYKEANQWFFILHLTVPFFLFFRFNCFLIFLKTYLKFSAQEEGQTGHVERDRV